MRKLQDNRKLFYAWQSDSDERVNKFLQRNILKIALKAIRKDEPELAVRMESDTTGAPGTPEIVKTIFDRIDSSFCVASDITIINPNTVGRKTPNPNVLLELGYAAKVLSWDRLITFFNSYYGDVENLPFDLRGRKPTIMYNLSPQVSDEELEKATTNLSQQLVYSLRQVLSVKALPTVASGEAKSQALKRKRDIQNMKALLSTVSTFAIEKHIAMFQESEAFSFEIFHYALNLQAFDTSPRFHLYDPKLRTLLSKLASTLGQTLEHGQFFSTQDGQIYRFVYGNWYRDNEDEKAATQLHREMNTLATALQEFTRYVNESYLELDLKKLNRLAVKEYQDFMKERPQPTKRQKKK